MYLFFSVAEMYECAATSESQTCKYMLHYIANYRIETVVT